MAACFWLLALPASAEIWGFIDDKGVGHFSATKLDARYELFSKETTVHLDSSAHPNSALRLNSPVRPDSSVRPEPVEGQNPDFDKLSPNGLVASAPNGLVASAPNGLAASALSPKLIKFFESSTTLKSIRPHIQAAAHKYLLDVELLQALIAAESGFNVTAISPKGAMGLMQLIPETAARYGVQGDKRTSQQQKLFDPHTNIHAGSHYLRDLLTLFKGQLDLALAAYNAGEGAVQRAGNKIPNYPETQNYVKTVMQMYAALKPPPPPPPPPVQAAPVLAPQPKQPASPDPLRPTRGRGNGLPMLMLDSKGNS